jgi:predicted AlkP superfamily pyrophosphatase or phosphodiesterase
VKKAIIIGYDGCRADVLTEIQDKNSAIGTLMSDGSELYLSYCGGVPYPEENTQDTSTAPGWCSVLTGKWADETGITSNDITKKVEPKTLLTSLVEDGLAEDSIFITRWKGHFDRDDATYNDEKKYCEDKGLDVVFNRCKNDKASLEATLEEINKEDCSDFIFVIYEQTDSTGHDFGFTRNSPYYKDAFVEADSYGYDTLEAIRNRETYEEEDWLIIITADHGGFGTGHGGATIQERMTFFVVGK